MSIPTAMIRPFILICCTLAMISAAAQQETRLTDSVEVLTEIVIKAYQYDRPLTEIPASVAFIGPKNLDRFSNSSLLPALNTVPGVRMEERSPGSYRLAMRGSSLRSPFGVRNVKVYWNDLPLTDAGGNTYLNLLDFASLQSAEIIKGPATSVYGAGTGGALMLQNESPAASGVEAAMLAGSNGLLRYHAEARAHAATSNIRVLYAHQSSDGYRQQTAMARDLVQANATFRVHESNLVDVSVLYADLFYQTPGGLTREQFEADPRQARPAGGPNPGATEQHAAIYNKTFFSGISYAHRWNSRWSNRTGAYGSFTRFDNPAIRNYEQRVEQGFGARSNTQVDFKRGKLNFGAEYQQSFSPVKTYANNRGVRAALQTDDEIGIRTYFLFAQTEFFLPKDFFLTVGASVNKLTVDFARFSNPETVAAKRDFDFVFSPRIALLKKMNDTWSLYGSYSQGYSPPTVQELYPSAGYFDQEIDPELGHNVEVGAKGHAFHNTLSFDLTAYLFRLDETIAIRRLEDGAEYFVNAGETAQQGAEAQITWSAPLTPGADFSLLKVWSSFTWNPYTFQDYEKDNVRLDGNDLTGVARHVVVNGIDVALRAGVYLNVTHAYTDRIPLDDANTAYADPYNLLGARVGFRRAGRRLSWDVFGGVDNALDETYSLGNDLNAVGGRYYNAAPARNYFLGFKTGWTLSPAP